MVRLDDATEFVVADIPGLIEGASEGRGLGHQFLRHIERARVLAILLDLAPVDERPPDEQQRVLLDELGRYRPTLLERPRLLVGSRSDLVDGSTDLDVAAWADGGTDDEARVVVSAVTGEGLSRLIGLLLGPGEGRPPRRAGRAGLRRAPARAPRACASSASTSTPGGWWAAPPSGPCRCPTSPPPTR